MELAGKRVLVVGLGLSGVAAARLCAARGAAVTVTDSKPVGALAAVLATLPAGVGQELGGHRRDTFLQADLIVLSPGVPVLPEVTAARAAGVPITGELELASRFVSAPLLAVTGTNGKSTTTTLAGAMMAASGRPTFVGGNLGTPLAEAVGTPAAGPGGICVVEVSSFQLETTERFAPRAGILLNVTPDHLDRHATMEAYAEAKALLFARQRPEDFAVMNIDDPVVEGLSRKIPSRCVPLSTRRPLPEGGWLADGQLRLRLPGGAIERYPAELPGLVGRHNLENALAAALAARLCGATAPEVRATLLSFTPLPHRMTLVGEAGGVPYFDDSKGTNVGAVVAALTGFPKPVVLLAGGRDKGGSYEPLAAVMKQVGRGAVLIGEAADRIAAALDGVVPIARAGSMDEAVQAAARLARPGDAVVLSPACASFDMFRNYEHRGDEYRAAVSRLVAAASGPGKVGA